MGKWLSLISMSSYLIPGILYKYHCEITDPTEYHRGPVEQYNHLDYSCIRSGYYHYYCKHHWEKRDCPIHSMGYRKR